MIPDKNKSICFVIPNWATSRGTGGAELQCYYLSEEFVKRGWKVEVLHRTNVKDQEIDYRFFNKSITYHTYKKGNSKLLNVLHIYGKLKKTNSYYYYNRTDARLLRGTCSMFCKNRNRKMIIAIANDSDVVDISLTDFYSYKKSLVLRSMLHYIDALLLDKIIRKFVFRANYFFAQTKKQQDLLFNRLNLQATVVPNSFVFQENNHRKKENIILWIANIRPQKHPDRLAKLIRQLDLGEWKIKMIGNYKGYESIINSIESPGFEALGQIAFSDVLQWIARSKILLNTSSSEGFPNTFIQAWFYRALVISFEFEPDNLFRDEGIGLCAGGDFNKFVSVVQEKINNGVSDLMVDKAYNYAKNSFNIENNVDKLINEFSKEFEV